MDITTILIIVNLSFNIIERLIKYTKKHTKFKSQCLGNQLEYETETEKNNK